ncbi:MAG: alkaline phosphatase family protein [Nanoarchaeota archaeon]
MKPDYEGGSIVNLMSSIAHRFKAKTGYPQLKKLPGRELKAKNIILLVLDGIGHHYLKRFPDSFLAQHMKGSMTSVFPSTTASCVTTFATGVAPQQHAITAWYMFFKEYGVVAAPLTFVPRFGGIPLDMLGLEMKELIDTPPLADRLKVKSYAILPKELTTSSYSKLLRGKSQFVRYTGLENFFRGIKRTVRLHNRRKFIYAYWPEFDGLSHAFGNSHGMTAAHFLVLDREVERLVKTLKDTTIIMTADHGFMDTTPKEIILMKRHPKMAECLSIPLCGEPRAVYCYVRPDKKDQFERYVKEKLKEYCTLHTSQSLIKAGYFGKGKLHPKLRDRIGDYVLLMKKNYIMKDALAGRKARAHRGNHGGISNEEMMVPLVVIDC